ncbi:MAG: galactokinase family protein [Bacteroidota bacterium]
MTSSRIFSPYRLCPLGAHIDHQGGPVLGCAFNIGTTLIYEALDTNEICITSEEFGEARFVIGDLDLRHWSRYAQGAARALRIRRGMKARVSGPLIGAGLSSSASVGLAYLKALADVNGIKLSREDLVRLDYELEHEQLGLQNGLLDQMSIVYGKKKTLLLMDTRVVAVSLLPDPPDHEFAWIVAYSGISRELATSGYNVRVTECHEAASSLQEGAKVLSDVPRDVFEARKSTLPDNLRKRAEHFFSEVERVQRGAAAWNAARLDVFGQLMNQSCQSSITNYESGNPVLNELHALASDTPGVYGSRFNGGGYGGCVVALAKAERAQDAGEEIAERFSALHPELASKVFMAEAVDGLE